MERIKILSFGVDLPLEPISTNRNKEKILRNIQKLLVKIPKDHFQSPKGKKADPAIAANPNPKIEKFLRNAFDI